VDDSNLSLKFEAGISGLCDLFGGKEAEVSLVFGLTPEISYCGHNLLLRNTEIQV